MPIAPHITSNLTGYDAPGFKALVMTAQTLIGAAQGIKQFYFELGLNMHIIEDAATINVTEKLSKEYLAKLGYTDIKTSSGAFPFLGAWPPRIDEAEAMICWNAVDTFLAGIDTAILKCRDEAFATPTKEGMANAVRMARHLDMLIGKQCVDMTGEAYKLEEKMIELEVRSILDICVGHDTLFMQHSEAPVTYLVVKDRVLAHNPAAALYTTKSYYRRVLSPDTMPERPHGN